MKILENFAPSNWFIIQQCLHKKILPRWCGLTLVESTPENSDSKIQVTAPREILRELNVPLKFSCEACIRIQVVSQTQILRDM